MHEQLASDGLDRLAELLALRPEVLHDPPPRDLHELAARLDDPYAVSAALQSAALPVLQVAEALQALGGTATRAELAELLGADHAAAAAAMDAALAWLVDRVVVRLGQAGQVHGSPALAACYPDPLRLGPPLRAVLAHQTADALRKILQLLRRPVPRSRAQAAAELAGHLRDPATVRALVATAPAAVQTWLQQRAVTGELGTEDDELSGYWPHLTGPEAVATRWATQRGLMVGNEWDSVMPAEVAVALRGHDHVAPFSWQAPPVDRYEVGIDAVAAESAAAATTFAAHATAVLDLVARDGVPMLKAGGVGARELTRLAKATGGTDVDCRLVLELAARHGLLAVVHPPPVAAPPAARLTVGDAFGHWRDAEPGDRYADLLQTWWVMGAVPTKVRENGQPLAAVRGVATCLGCTAARHSLVDTMARELPAGWGSQVQHVGPAATWHRPLVHADLEQDEVRFTSTWLEAERLGVVARGALSALGRLLLANDHEAVAMLAADLLPGTTDHADFGADLTAVVAGTPSARVTHVLDRCAVRESRGGAVVWRLTPAGVRRALDEGATGDELLQELKSVARRDLPQPLAYLVRDVARRHGAVRVRPVVSCLRSDDAALLAQVAGDRALRRLGLSLLAPTVLASARPADETILALRGAGYLPMPEDDDGTIVTPPAPVSRRSSKSGRRQHPAPPPTSDAPEALDPRALAASLLAGAGGASHGTAAQRSAVVESVAARRIGSLAPRLPASQVRLLAHAVDAGARVVIEYRASSGGLTRRTISDLELQGGTVAAWCELRQDDRVFTLSRIQAVHPAP